MNILTHQHLRNCRIKRRFRHKTIADPRKHLGDEGGGVDFSKGVGDVASVAEQAENVSRVVNAVVSNGNADDRPEKNVRKILNQGLHDDIEA